MKLLNWNKIVAWLVVLFVSSCVEPYTPEVVESANSYLVVNGTINAQGPTRITLLRTQNLSEEEAAPIEEGAFVTVEAEDGESHRLSGLSGGQYYSYLNLSFDKKYRLFIRTQEGEEYATDFMDVLETPAIEEVSWRAVDDKVKVYLSTSDPENKTWYYRWEYEEAWQFRSAFNTALKYENGKIRHRTAEDPVINMCWRSVKSRTIEVSSSRNLVHDVISNYELMTIPYNAEKISVKYGMHVKQYAITREAYEYWEMLKKNTESIGTLYDPLPSQLKSNIRSLSNPGELVVGFVSISTVAEKTGYVYVQDLPEEWRTFEPYCKLEEMYLDEKSLGEVFETGFYMPVGEIYIRASPDPIGYTYAERSCVDCTTTGSNAAPDFWE